MNNLVWILMSCTGDGADLRKDVEGVYSSESSAKQECERLNAELKEYKLHWDNITSSFTTWEKRPSKFQWVDPSGASYEVWGSFDVQE